MRRRKPFDGSLRPGRKRHGRALGVRLFAILVLALLPGLTLAAGDPCDFITMYSRAGCPHCAAGADFLAALGDERPGLAVRVLDVAADSAARQSFDAINAKHGIERPGVPTFVVCDAVLVGFRSAQTTGARIRRLLEPATTAPATPDFEVDLPLFGRVSPAALGLPAFTVALGLVDGFNPCAMWVLLFLLSMLVNLRDRLRIALVAGTFVLVSGLAYFAFMAAWFNAFLLVGYSRAIEAAVGVAALVIGAVHVKDFLAPGAGVSFSIPAAARPGLYQQVARVVRAENLPVALAAALVLAVMVNLVELVCTAGLPAVYTRVLSHYAIEGARGYAYLALYNLAYIFDDAVITTIAVVTLGKHKLQASEGRWLKLLSGTVIAVLGVLLLAAPEVLVR